MKRWFLRRVNNVESEAIVELLTTRQHLRPLDPLRDVMQALTDELGCCPEALRRAVEWLGFDHDQSVGRLRRTELIQLARAVHRYWRQDASQATDATAR